MFPIWTRSEEWGARWGVMGEREWTLKACPNWTQLPKFVSTHTKYKETCKWPCIVSTVDMHLEKYNYYAIMVIRFGIQMKRNLTWHDILMDSLEIQNWMRLFGLIFRWPANNFGLYGILDGTKFRNHLGENWNETWTKITMDNQIGSIWMKSTKLLIIFAWQKINSQFSCS